MLQYEKEKFRKASWPLYFPTLPCFIVFLFYNRKLLVRLECQLNVCQKCRAWKLPLRTAAFYRPKYPSWAKELNRISFTQRQPSPPQTAWVTLVRKKKEKKGGLAGTHGFYQKRHEASWELSSLPKNTQQQDPRNVCRHCVTMEGLCDQEHIKQMLLICIYFDTEDTEGRFILRLRVTRLMPHDSAKYNL